MSDLVISDVDPVLERQIAERARAHRRSLSDEAKLLIRKALGGLAMEAPTQKGLGTAMMELVNPEDRGDDLIFEIRDDDAGTPPDCK